jgi:hypothetical protein
MSDFIQFTNNFLPEETKCFIFLSVEVFLYGINDMWNNEMILQ